MSDFTLKTVVTPEVTINDPLSELLRVGARGLIAQAVEAELAMMLVKHRENKLPDGRPAVARNGYLPERTIQIFIVFNNWTLAIFQNDTLQTTR